VAKTIQAIRGMNDCLPTETPLWQWVENKVRSVLSAYGYAEIRMPIVESTPLFARAIGEVTDVVEKELISVDDIADKIEEMELSDEIIDKLLDKVKKYQIKSVINRIDMNEV